MSGVALEWESEHSLKGRQKSSSFKLREREKERGREREHEGLRAESSVRRAGFQTHIQCSFTSM